MANQEHLDILKQGVKTWNMWRNGHPDIHPDLSGADLNRANLRDANFRYVNLSSANLNSANLLYAYLRDADLSRARLREAKLSRADLRYANLRDADLSRARLREANLRYANLSKGSLSQTDLRRTDLIEADLRYADLTEADLTGATIGWTVFGNVNLNVAKGLDTAWHSGPSTIGIDTIIRSQGKISDIFLRNAGVPDPIIEAIPSLVGSLEPIQYYTCFISYSSRDQDFAERLHVDLQAKGVRCWFAPHDLRPGTVFLRGIEEAIRVYDKLLLILSERSVKSQWVEYEVDAALHKEVSRNQLVLFPIRLDNTVLESTTGWAASLRRRHIGDFTRWKDHDAYQKAFNRLLRDLKAEAQKMGSRDAATNDS